MTMEIATPSEAVALLSSMYLCEPSREALANWRSALAEDTSIFLVDLKEAINGINLDSTDELETVLSEYTRLFIGPYKLSCPPWESVYISPKRLMMQESAAQVRELYAQAGLSVNTDEVMPDHIGAELSFLAVLLKQTHAPGAAREDQMKMTEKLLNEHILKWLPDFTRDMENSAETVFYKTLAKTTQKIIDVIGK